MSWLARLQALEKMQECPNDELTKLPNAPSVSFVSSCQAGDGKSLAWDGTEERVAIAEHDTGLSRREADVRAYDAALVHWMNCNPPTKLDPNHCADCGKPLGRIGEDAVPFLTGGGGHAWLHHGCHAQWFSRRRAEAVEALALHSPPV